MDEKLFDEIIKQYHEEIINYELFCQNIEYIIKRLPQIEKIKNFSLTWRAKTIDSLKDKLTEKGHKYKNLSDITDLAGIRIITSYSDQVDIVAKIIEQEFEIDKVNTIDKRKMMEPDQFGYLSLHYIIKLNNERKNLREYERFKELRAEIQIRTILQHAWADIEHDLGYKTKDTIPRNLQRDFNRLSGLLELADKEFLSIRNSLSVYKDYVSSNINEFNEEILIDKISLSEYIHSNQQLLKLNRQIADICDSKLSISKNIERYIKYLQLIEIKTIKELNNALLEEKDLAYFIAKNLLNIHKHSTLPTAIGLFYVFYARTARFMDVNIIDEILNKTKIVFEGESSLDFANRLINLIKSFKEKY